MSKGWQIGGSPRRDPGVVCFNAKCKLRDAATNACLGRVCQDRVEGLKDGVRKTEDGQNHG